MDPRGSSLFHSFHAADAETLASMEWRDPPSLLEAGDSKPCRASTSQGNIKREGGVFFETPLEAKPNISISAHAVVEKVEKGNGSSLWPISEPRPAAPSALTLEILLRTLCLADPKGSVEGVPEREECLRWIG